MSAESNSPCLLKHPLRLLREVDWFQGELVDRALLCSSLRFMFRSLFYVEAPCGKY